MFLEVLGEHLLPFHSGSCRIQLLEVVRKASFILRGAELWLVIADFLVPESFVLTAVNVGQVKIDVLVNLQQDKCYSLFCNFYLYMNGKMLCL